MNAALQWARDGWPVLPCTPDKSPYLPPPGKLLATTDREQIKKWWSQRFWPDALIGGRCDGKVVLDLDSYKPGHQADLATIPELPATRVHRSARGGTHRIYLDPDGLCRSSTLGPNKTIDVRAGTSNDYIILPSPGTAYAVVSDCPLAAMPPWLPGLILVSPVSAEGQPGGDRPLPDALPLPDGFRARLPEGKDQSEWSWWLAKRAIEDGLRPGELRTLLEADETTTDRIAADRRQQAIWWPGEFWRLWDGNQAAPGKKPGQNMTDDEGGKRPASSVLLDIAKQRYSLGMTAGDEAYAVPRDGPNIAQVFRGRGGFRSEMAYKYKQQTGRAPNQNALTDAITTLEGEAREQPRRDLPLRVAWHEGELVLDLGTTDGRAVVVGPGYWKIVDRSPVLFLRTALTGELPEPQRGGKLARDLFPFLNVPKADRKLLAACLVALLWPDIAHPIPYLNGEEGTGKSTLTRILRSLVDPSLVTDRRSPGREEDWETTIAGQWVIALNNMSSLPDWLSDALCTAVDGSGSVKRKLYTDGDLSAQQIRRAFIINSIDPTLASRGDLVDRVIPFELEPIGEYRDETDLAREWDEARPLALGALLNLATRTLHYLPDVRRSGTGRRFRMVGFANLVVAMDKAVAGPSALERYRDKVAAGVSGALESDPFAAAIRKLGEQRGGWSGTATDLYSRAVPPKHRVRQGPGSPWPSSAQTLGMRLTRIKGMLRKSGVLVESRHTRDGKVWAVTKIRAGE